MECCCSCLLPRKAMASLPFDCFKETSCLIWAFETLDLASFALQINLDVLHLKLSPWLLQVAPEWRSRGGKLHHIAEPWEIFHFDLGCDLIASQDFLILKLFLLLEKCQLPFLLMFTLVLESNQMGKRLWNEEGKIAQKPSKCQKKKEREKKRKKILCLVKT